MTLRNLLFAVIGRRVQHPAWSWCCSSARCGYAHGWVTLGQITAAMLYVEALGGPLDRLVGEMDRLQVGVASTTPAAGHRGGAAGPGAGRPSCRPAGLVGADLRFAYREGHDVLHGVDLDLRPGERLAIVGPSGSGKSTLGRLLSGINGPRTGRSRSAASSWSRCRWSTADRGRAGDPGAPRVRRHGARQHRPGPRGLRRRGGRDEALRRSTRWDWVRAAARAAWTPCSARATRR